MRRPQLFSAGSSAEPSICESSEYSPAVRCTRNSRPEANAPGPAGAGELDHDLRVAGEAREHVTEIVEHIRLNDARIEPDLQHFGHDHPRRLLLGARQLLLGGLEAVDRGDDHAGTRRVLVIDLALDQHDRVLLDGAAGLLERVGEDHELDRAVEVLERREHHRVALLCAQPLDLADHAADRHALAVLALAHGTEVDVGLGRHRDAQLLQRMRGDVEADRLLLHRQQLVLLELAGRDRRVAWARELPPGSPPPRSMPRSKIEP